MPGREVAPASGGRPVGRLGQRSRLGRITEHVSGRRQLGQHHDVGAPRGGLGDGGDRGSAVQVYLADTQADLAGSDPDWLILDTRHTMPPY